MNEQNKSDNPSSQIPGIAIIAILLGLILVSNEPFKPTRPPMSDSDKGSSENVRSRLWQDPFAAVSQHRKKYHSDNLLPVEAHKTLNRNNHKVAYHLERVPQSMCNTSIEWPDGTPVTWPASRTLKDAHSIEDLRCQIQVQFDDSECHITIQSVNTDEEKRLKIKAFREISANQTGCALQVIHSKKILPKIVGQKII